MPSTYGLSRSSSVSPLVLLVSLKVRPCSCAVAMRKTANEYWIVKSLVFLTFCLYISSVFWALRSEALLPTALRNCELSNVMGAGACCG